MTANQSASALWFGLCFDKVLARMLRRTRPICGFFYGGYWKRCVFLVTGWFGPWYVAFAKSVASADPEVQGQACQCETGPVVLTSIVLSVVGFPFG